MIECRAIFCSSFSFLQKFIILWKNFTKSDARLKVSKKLCACEIWRKNENGACAYPNGLQPKDLKKKKSLLTISSYFINTKPQSRGAFGVWSFMDETQNDTCKIHSALAWSVWIFELFRFSAKTNKLPRSCELFLCFSLNDSIKEWTRCWSSDFGPLRSPFAREKR